MTSLEKFEKGEILTTNEKHLAASEALELHKAYSHSAVDRNHLLPWTADDVPAYQAQERLCETARKAKDRYWHIYCQLLK